MRILEYAAATRLGSHLRYSLLVPATALFAFVVVACVLTIKVWHGANEGGLQAAVPLIRCGNGLHEIGLRIQAYRNANGGEFPPSLTELDQIGGPLETLQRDSGTSVAYLGNRLDRRASADEIVAFLPPTSTRNQFVVLYESGAVDYLSRGNAANAALLGAARSRNAATESSP